MYPGQTSKVENKKGTVNAMYRYFLPFHEQDSNKDRER
jgi:hypothetical protein